MILGPQFTSAPPKFMVLRLKRTRVTHVMIEPVPCIGLVYILAPTPAINNLRWEKEEKYSTYYSTLGICWVCSFSCIPVLRKNLGVSVISEWAKIVWEATKEVITCINVRVTKSSSPNKCNRRVYIYYLVKIFFPVEGLEIFCQRLYISDCRYPVHAPKVKKKKTPCLKIWTWSATSASLVYVPCICMRTHEVTTKTSQTLKKNFV